VLTVDILNWEHTLALIDSCDVVVSVDTAVAHAAAALGKPTVVLVHRACYYTWNPRVPLAQSQWYPRCWSILQHQPGDWSQALQQARNTTQNILTGEIHDTRTT